MKLITLTSLLFLFSMSMKAGAATDDMVTAAGAGIADGSRFPSSTQARMLSRRAAMVDAQRNLLETIEGVRVTSGTTVENMMVTSDKVGTRVKGVIQGAFVIDESTTQDGDSWVTELTLGICVNRSAAECKQKPTLQQAIATSLAENEEVETYTGDTVEPSESSSGLIVDVSAVEFSPFLDVRIRTEAGEELYGPSLVTLESGNDWLNFAPDLNKAREMTDVVGDSPLLVEAESARGGYVVVVSGEDAARISGSNQGNDFLKRGRVVFVMSR